MPGKLTPFIVKSSVGQAATSAVGFLTPPVAPSGGSDFDARKTAPGVFRWFDFDSADPNDPHSRGAYGGGDSDFGWNYGANPAFGPFIDTAVKCGDAGASIRFDILQGPNNNAAFAANFSSDYSLLFDQAGDEFFVQWRQRFDDNLIATNFLHAEAGAGQVTALKQCHVGTGNQATYDPRASSCSDIEVVATSHGQHKMSILYNGCGLAWGMYEAITGDIKIQNAMSPACLYNDIQAVGPTAVPPACFPWVANEWMTFQIGITLGPKNPTTHRWENSRVRLWVGRENEPCELVVDFNTGTMISSNWPENGLWASSETVYTHKFGKVHLDAYQYNKDATQVHPTAYTWFDELIMSTQRIPDPSSFPAWRQNKTVGTLYEIANTSNYLGYVFKAPDSANGASNTIDPWAGYAVDGDKWWVALSGGHNQSPTGGQAWQNPVLAIDFSQPAPVVIEADAGTTYSATMADMIGERYYDGRPCSRHLYYSLQHIPGAHTADGNSRVMTFTAYATYAMDLPGGYRGGTEVCGFNLTTDAWEPQDTNPDWPYPNGSNLILQSGVGPSVCKDERNGNVYVSAGRALYRWNAGLNTWDLIVDSISSGPLTSWDGCPSMVDVTRNRVVCLQRGGNDGLWIKKLQCVDISTGAVTDIPITGPITVFNGAPFTFAWNGALIHNLDTDKYWAAGRDASSVTKLYEIDPGGASTELMTLSTAAASPCNRLAYFQRLGCVIYYGKATENIKFIPTR